MFENLLVVAAVAAVLWLGAFVYYLMTSRQQKDIAREIEALEKQLGENDSALSEGE
jgi:CcmD family protein